MQFELRPGVDRFDISVIYRPQEYSFGVESGNDRLPSAYASVQVNELQMQLDHQGRVLYVDGYCPHVGWCEMETNPPVAHRGALFVTDIDIIAGTSIALSASRWPVAVNRMTGWVCIGEQLPSATSSAVELARDIIAVVDARMLKSIWLKPHGLSG